MTTRDKLTFVHSMARSTRATVRQCEALLRYAGTLARLTTDNLADTDWGRAERWKRNDQRERIQRKVMELCRDISERDHNRPEGVHPVFASPVLKIRTPGGEEIEVPS